MDTFAVHKDVVNKAKRISPEESLQLLGMLRSGGVKYTENMNGCFIDLLSVSDGMLGEVQQFLDMCIKVHVKNEQRSEQIKQYAQELERHSYVPVRPENVHRNPRNKEVDEINESNLSSLEKSIMKENLKFSLVEHVDPAKGRKSVTPKFVGLKAKLLKNVRSPSRATPSGAGKGSAASPEKAVAKKQVAVEDDDELDDADLETDMADADDTTDVNQDDDADIDAEE